MTTIREELIERIDRLDEAAQRRVLEFVRSLDDEQVSLAEVLAQASELRAEFRTKYGEHFAVSVQDLLDEIREEASWPRGL